MVNEFGELLRIGFLERVEAGRFRAQRLHQPVHHFPRAFRSESGDQHLFGEVHTALQHEIARHRHLVELFQYQFGLIVGDAGDARHFVPDGLHFVLVQLTKNFGAGLIAENHHQDRGFANA